MLFHLLLAVAENSNRMFWVNGKHPLAPPLWCFHIKEVQLCLLKQNKLKTIHCILYLFQDRLASNFNFKIIAIPFTCARTCEEISSVILTDCVSIVCCKALIRTLSLQQEKMCHMSMLWASSYHYKRLFYSKTKR